MNNPTITERQPETNPPPKPLYQLVYLIAMLLEREEEAKKATQHQEEKRR